MMAQWHKLQMEQQSFILQALDNLRWINAHIADPNGSESELRALERARDELMELMQVAASRTNSKTYAPVYENRKFFTSFVH